MSEARTNKLKPRQSTEINPGPASNENKIILPQNTTAHLAEINNEEGSIAYDTDQQKVVINDGSGFAPVSSGGGTPTGDPNTIAFFNALGNLSDNTAATFDETLNALALQTPGAAGSVVATANGSFAHGNAGLGAAIIASGDGSHAHGVSAEASGVGAHAHGNSATAIGTASHAGGISVLASGTGSSAVGSAINGGVFTSSGSGSQAFGLSDNSTILASASGSMVVGHAQNGPGLKATATGALAHGDAFGGEITASGNGAFAQGSTANESLFIRAIGPGSFASGANGIVAAGGAIISATGKATFAMGTTYFGLNIDADGEGSLAMGRGEDQNHQTSGQASQVFGSSSINSGDVSTVLGKGHTSASYAALLIGQYGVLAETTNAWVDTETAFAIGNGSGVGTESLAFRITKGGHVNSSSASPTIDPGINAGAGAAMTPIASCTDTAGRMRITTGTGATNGQLIEITFATPYTSTPSVTITPEEALAAGLGGLHVASVGPAGFVIANLSNIADATEYDFNYNVIGLE